MFLKFRFKNIYLDWVFLFILSFSIRLISINFGLPFEHHPDEEYFFGVVDRTIDGGHLYPGIYNYGYIFYYITHFSSLLARVFVDSAYIREYEILFMRLVIAAMSGITVILIYEISRRIYQHRLISLLTAGIFSVAIGGVTLARFISSDHLSALLLVITVLISIEYIKTGSRKLLIWMFIIAGLTISPKFSYFPLLVYCLMIYLIQNGVKPFKKRLVELFKYSVLTIGFFILGNIFEIFHFYSWLGLNYYFLRAYSTPDFFYFKSVHQNYFENLWTIINFIFADYYYVSIFSGVIALLFLALLIFQSRRLFKTNKKILLALIIFPVIFILLSAKAVVFQMRSFLAVIPFFIILLSLPFNQFRLRFIQIIFFITIFVFLSANSILSSFDVSSKNPEKEVMNLIKNSNKVFALPNVFQYPSIEYAYYNSEIKLNLSNHPFFIENNNKIIYYRTESNFEDILAYSDYFIIEQQMMQNLRYKIANEKKEEPFFESIDIVNQQVAKQTLNDDGFSLIGIYQNSDFETIAKYDPAYLGQKRFLIYEKKK